jgi:hypothetical protein
MGSAERLDVRKRLEEVLPGNLKAWRGSGRRLVVASWEGRGDRIAPDGLPEPDLWRVAYAALKEDGASEDGWRVEVRMSSEHDDPFDAGMRFQEWAALLPAEKEEPYPSLGPLEERAWAKEVFDRAHDLAERHVVRELRREAALLKQGKTPYPPEESVLGQVLAEIDALPRPG